MGVRSFGRPLIIGANSVSLRRHVHAAARPGTWLAMAVPCRIRSSRTRNTITASSVSSLFTGRKRIAGRNAASQIAAASAASFFWRFTKGLTQAGAISRTA